MEKVAPLAEISSIVPSPDETLESEETKLKIFSTSTPSLSESEESFYKPKPKIPDGGWGWIVVFSSLIISMIADGISFSFGILYIEFLNEFNVSKSATSWIGSLFMAVPLLTGPVMSALVDKYGCRWMTILGGLISATGFIISSRVRSIGVMYFTFGTLAGLGLGLCYVTAIVSIAFWFDKKRTLAVGLGAAGTGIGTFIYSPFTTYLIKEFGWRGTTLILSGSFLNICVCGAVMRDPDWITRENKISRLSTLSISSIFANTVDLQELKSLLKSGKDTEYLVKDLETSIENYFNTTSKKSHTSVVNLPTYLKQNEKVPIEVLEQLFSNKKLYNVLLENYPSLLLHRSSTDKGINPVTLSMKLKKTKENIEEQQESSKALIPKEILKQSPKLENRWFQNKSSQNHYFRNMKFHRQSLIHRGTMINMNKYRLRASSCPNIYKVSMASIPKKGERWYSDIEDLVRGMLDFSLFAEFHFFLMSLSTIILFVWFIVPYFYLVEMMLRNDYSEEQASYTVSVIGIANTIGMILFGWAGDQKWMNITKTYAISLVLCGVSTFGFIVFISNLVLVQLCAALFGLFLSSSFSFTPGILLEMVPLDRFTTAYGLQLLCMGIGNLLGPPLAGYLFDVTGSWHQSFYQAGFWIAISGIFIAVIPYSKNRKIIGKGPVEKDVEKGAI